MIRPLSILAGFVVVVVVVLGAFTRLADAGLGCPDWPTCYGHLWIPDSEAEIQKANEKFQHTPVETDKTWPEQVHRIFASSLGLIILTMFVLVLRESFRAKQPIAWKSVSLLLALMVFATIARIGLGDGFDPIMIAIVILFFANLIRLSLPQQNSVRLSVDSSLPFKHVACLAGLVVLQGWFGMWTVTLKLWPQVVTTHLLGGFATLSLIWLLIQRVYGYQWRIIGAPRLRIIQIQPIAIVGLVVVILQIVIGGWLSSNYAALACPDFPLCQNQLWPTANFAQGFNVAQTIGPNYLGGQLSSDARTAIHLTHRLGAIVVLLVCSWLAIRLWLIGEGKTMRFALILTGVLVAQLTLGVLNIVLSLPILIAVAHNAGGALLLVVLLTLNHRIVMLTKSKSE